MNFIVNIFKLLKSLLTYAYYTLKRAWLPFQEEVNEFLRYFDTPQYRTKSFGEPTYNEDYSIREDSTKEVLKTSKWDKKSAPYCETP